MICLGESEYYKYNNPEEETLNERVTKPHQPRMQTRTSAIESNNTSINNSTASLLSQSLKIDDKLFSKLNFELGIYIVSIYIFNCYYKMQS